jgi:hypothetical protein
VSFDQPEYLTLLGVPAETELGEHRGTADRDFKRAARRLDQPDVRVRKTLAQLGRQTGGPRIVVSDDAVLNPDNHPALL